MIDLKKIKKAYCVGIKGAGVAAVVQILHSRGIAVSGSDTGELFFTDGMLKRDGILFYETFATENVPLDADVVIYSTAYNDENNVELAEAKKLGLPLVSYPEMLGMLFDERLGIAVCGSHGKTTTSALLAQALKGAGVDPGAIVGSKVIDWKTSVLSGSGDYFVAEADEYQNKLQYYQPWSAILTSVDWDHPDFFPDFESYKKVFCEFVSKIKKTGFLVVWGDSSDTLEVAEQADCPVLTYGFTEDNDYRVISHQSSVIGQKFEIEHGGKSLGIFETSLSGKHNVLNCAAVIALCHTMRLDMEKVREAIAGFKGTSRRFEIIGARNGALLIDDYAHHPDEIKATLAGARERYGDKNIKVVFHPHTFTRTKALLQEFSQSFDDADKVIVIDIYGSAREEQGGVSSQDLVNLINKYTFGKAEYIPTINETIDFFAGTLDENDLLITMGAGDVWKIADKLKT